MDKIKLGISSCLLGELVRYDGRHKLDNYLNGTLGKFVDWVGVCPEVECGLGVPREAMHLRGTSGAPKLITRNSNIDHTDKMVKWAKKALMRLEKENLSGFIFKSNSPSCGLNNVLSKSGSGIFARLFTGHFKLMPVEDDENLRDEKTRENFIEKIYAFRKTRGLKPGICNRSSAK